jgi:hypothetical protein
VLLQNRDDLRPPQVIDHDAQAPNLLAQLSRSTRRHLDALWRDECGGCYGHIASRIFFLREKRVMLDSDLSARNVGRFPPDFAFVVSDQELGILKSQIATSSWGGKRKLPWAFTEHGALMAATLLRSARAIEVSVYVVRAFVQLREAMAAHKEIAKRVDELERKVGTQDGAIREILQAIRSLAAAPENRGRKRIGFV